MKVRALFCFSLFWLFSAGICRADGGTFQFSGASENLRISVFTSPGNPSAGPVDLSVLVQDAATRTAVLDAEVRASLTPETPAPGVSAWAPPICAANSAASLQSFQLSRGHAENLLYYGAMVEIPSPGKWRLALTVRRGNRQTSVENTLEVAGQRAPWISYWHLFLFPPVAVGLFAAVQRRKSSGDA